MRSSIAEVVVIARRKESSVINLLRRREMAENEEKGLVAQTPMEIMERVITKGDLGQLTPKERVDYYGAVCQSLGLNPLTRPFEYLKLTGKLVLYARKDCTEQLRAKHKVSISELTYQRDEDILTVTAKAMDEGGRSDVSTGVVSLAGLSGDRLANARMKAETKAKRRVTLSLIGLGWMDESEIVTTGGVSGGVDFETGEVQQPKDEAEAVADAFRQADVQEVALNQEEAWVVGIKGLAKEKGYSAKLIEALLKKWAEDPRSEARYQKALEYIEANAPSKKEE